MPWPRSLLCAGAAALVKSLSAQDVAAAANESFCGAARSVGPTVLAQCLQACDGGLFARTSVSCQSMILGSSWWLFSSRIPRGEKPSEHTTFSITQLSHEDVPRLITHFDPNAGASKTWGETVLGGTKDSKASLIRYGFSPC